MKARLIMFISIIFISLGFLFCSSPYNIELSVPQPNASAEDVFPGAVNGVSGNWECGDDAQSGGTMCNTVYGDLGRISAAQFPNNDAAYAFYTTYVDGLSTTAKAGMGANLHHWTKYTHSDGYLGFVWHNTNWMFEIAADTEENLDAIADAFAYIEKK